MENKPSQVTPPSPIEEALKDLDIEPCTMVGCRGGDPGGCSGCAAKVLAAEVRRLQAREKAVEGLVRTLEAAQTALIVSSPERTDCVLGLIRAALAAVREAKEKI